MTNKAQNGSAALQHNPNKLKVGQGKSLQWYKYPASIQNALVHREAFKLAATKHTAQEYRCPCCQHYVFEKEYPLCHSSQQIFSERRNARQVPLYLYFTYLKGLIVFLAIRFFLYDFFSLYRSFYGSYCSELFKKDHKACTYYLSAYNLKDQITDNFNFDKINAIFTLVSIVYFFFLKQITQEGKNILESNLIAVEDYSLLATNVPSFIITKNQQGKRQIDSTQQACTRQIFQLFSKHVQNMIAQRCKSMADQYYFILQNTKGSVFSHTSHQKERDIRAHFRQNKNLLEEIGLEIATGVYHCYDLPELFRISSMENKIKSQRTLEQSSEDSMKVILEALEKLNDLTGQVKKQLEDNLHQNFHPLHFSGKSFVTFQYKFMRDLILKSYEENPNCFKINGEAIVLQPAPNPVDIYWQNMIETEENKKKYNSHSWSVMAMMLILSFAILIGVKLIESKFQVLNTSETFFRKVQRMGMSMLSAVTATLINKGLVYAIGNLVQMQKHTSKLSRQNSFIIKSFLAQSINSFFIYIIIYVINPGHPLEPYGLAEKAISLVVVSGFVTFFFQVFRMGNSMTQEERQIKFQIELNKEYQYPKFDQEGMYIFYTLMVYFVSFFGFLVPVITPFALISFFVLYWVDKYNAFRRSSLDSFDQNIGDLIISIIQISVLLSTISYFYWDLNIQKEPKVKILNLMCILFALNFTGFQIFIRDEVKKCFLHYNKKKEIWMNSYESTSFEITYQTYLYGGKRNSNICRFQILQKCISSPKDYNPNEIAFDLINKVIKFEGMLLQQSKNNHTPFTCSLCNQQMSHQPINNIFCNHPVCFSCFWNNIYYKIEMLSEINCLLCHKTIDQTLYFPQLMPRLKKRVQLIRQKIKPGQKKRICAYCLKICHTQTVIGQLGTQCPSCHHQYCKNCHFQDHSGKDCLTAFQERPGWKKCNHCSLIIQPTNICYSHFPQNRVHTKCFICLLGWSDIYNHRCKNHKSLQNSWFISILVGILDMVILVFSTLALIATFVFLITLFLLALIVASPFILVYTLTINIFCQGCNNIKNLTLLLPITAVKGLHMMIVAFVEWFFSFQIVEKGINTIPNMPIQIKNHFYQHNHRGSNIFNYTHIQIHSKTRRITYFFIMLLLLPILFPLAAIFFILSAWIVFAYTLVLLPIFISKQKEISIWIPIIYYPVMLVFYFVPLYFGQFIKHQIIDLVTFYLNYTKTMIYYLFCSPRNDSQQSNSLYDEHQDEHFC